MISTEVIRPPLEFREMDEIYAAFKKVVGNIDKLKSHIKAGVS